MDYESGETLRAAVEERFGRRLTEQEWLLVDPDHSYTGARPFGEDDFDDLSDKVQQLKKRTPQSAEERSRITAMSRVRRVAAEIRPVVEEERLTLFGRADAPFENAAEAGAWIEANEGDITKMRVALELNLPARDMSIQVLHDLRDWLDERLASLDQGATLGDILANAPGLRSISTPISLLPYLPGFDESVSAMGYKRARALPGSTLEQLLDAAERIEAATGWKLVAAVHHLLTGGLMSGIVTATNGVSVTSEGGVRESITLYVPYPSLVPANAVRNAYTQARKDSRSRRSRARGSELGDRLVTFVAEHPELDRWGKLRELWNAENADHLFSTNDSMQTAYRRAGGTDR